MPALDRYQWTGSDGLPFDTGDSQETTLRSPLRYLGAIASPTFVFEGTETPATSSRCGS